MKKVRWGTVSTVLEPDAVLLGFAAHHLQHGADEMHLYLDHSHPQFQGWVRGHPRLKVVICDTAYWRQQHGISRPNDFRERQVLNANHAFQKASCDWLAHVDADEFIIRIPLICDFLAAQPASVSTMSLQNAERVNLRSKTPRTIYAGVFRVPFTDAQSPACDRIYGAGSQYLSRGFSGYAHGKTFFRVGADVRLDLHGPVRSNAWVAGVNPDCLWFPRIGLLHVDGFTRAHWEDKLKRKTRVFRADGTAGYNPMRIKQISAFAASSKDNVDTDWLFSATREVSHIQALRLLARKKLYPFKLDIERALKSQFPDLAVDISPKAIDAALKALPTS